MGFKVRHFLSELNWLLLLLNDDLFLLKLWVVGFGERVRSLIEFLRDWRNRANLPLGGLKLFLGFGFAPVLFMFI